MLLSQRYMQQSQKSTGNLVCLAAMLNSKVQIFLYGCMFCSVASSQESCSSNIRYSVNGTSPECCRVDGSTCGVRCDLDLGISNATINVTFTCFDLASITLFSKGDIFNGMILEENLTLTNDNQSTSQDGLALNRTIACVTSLFLRLRFSAAITDPASIEFSNVTCSPTSTPSPNIATVTTDTEGSEVPCSDDEKPCSGTAIPTTRDPSVVTAIPTSRDASMVAETSTVIRTAVTTQPVRTDSSSVTTAIIGASVTIASLLLLIAMAIIILTLVLGTRRKKHIATLTAVSNNYETVSRDSTAGIPPLPDRVGPRFIERSRATNVHAMTEIPPQGWDAYPSLPRPPTDPGFATIEEWVKAKQDAAAVSNLNYASTLSIASNSNMSEPPDYETIQDAQRKHFLFRESGMLPSAGLSLRSRSMQDFRTAHKDRLWSATVDRARNRQDMASKSKMAQLLEEEADPRIEGRHGGFSSTNALTIARIPYRIHNGPSTEVNSADAISTDHSVDNDLYEATGGGTTNEYMAINENFYENSDQGPPTRAPSSSVRTRPTLTPEQPSCDDDITAQSPLMGTSPTYTTMNSILTLSPLRAEEQTDGSGSNKEASTERRPSQENEVPGYSKVKKLRKVKQRSASPADDVPPVPPYLAAGDGMRVCGESSQAHIVADPEVGMTALGERKPFLIYANTIEDLEQYDVVHTGEED